MEMKIFKIIFNCQQNNNIDSFKKICYPKYIT